MLTVGFKHDFDEISGATESEMTISIRPTQTAGFINFPPVRLNYASSPQMINRRIEALMLSERPQKEKTDAIQKLVLEGVQRFQKDFQTLAECFDYMQGVFSETDIATVKDYFQKLSVIIA